MYLSYIQLLRELVEDGSVGVLVLLHHGGYEGDQLVPEFKVVQSRSSVLGVSFSLVRINLK